MSKTLAVVPARGGSTGLKRKNLLPDANGIPLVLASARAARDAGCYVVVSTDDAEIKSLATIDGHHVHDRGPELANVPVDEVLPSAIEHWLQYGPNMEHNGPVLLVQPTVQPITADLLKWFLNECRTYRGGGDLTYQPVALGVEDRHLIWATKYGLPQPDRYELLTDRIDRQADAEWPVREMGVRWWPTATDVQHPPASVVTWPHPLVDIDTAADYQQITKRLNIWFQLRANKQVGIGHLRRVLTLAEGLQHHNIEISYTEDSDHTLVDPIYTERGWHGANPPGQQPDVVVYDKLDTATDDYRHDAPVVTLEDRGAGEAYATAAINAMYPPWREYYYSRPRFSGAKYAVLRPEFLIGDYQVNADAMKVLVLFGGTDPADLKDFVRSSLAPIGALNVGPLGVVYRFIGPGEDVSIAAAMHDADLLITSGGRTVFEAAAVGIPTIVMCQNMRETTHTHLGVGNTNLGLGRIVTPEQLRHIVTETLGDYELRRDMSATAKASIDGYGADRVRRIIEHVGLYGEAP